MAVDICNSPNRAYTHSRVDIHCPHTNCNIAVGLGLGQVSESAGMGMDMDSKELGVVGNCSYSTCMSYLG